MELYGKADLIRRWIYTRQGVRKALSWHDSPTPFLIADYGRLTAWRLEEIELFEQRHPELIYQGAKALKSRDRSGKTPCVSPKIQISIETFLGGRDIRERWRLSRQQFDRIRVDNLFPNPSYVFNEGRGRVWSQSLIQSLEDKYGHHTGHAILNLIRINAQLSKPARPIPHPSPSDIFPQTKSIGSEESRRHAESPIYNPTDDTFNQ